MLYRVVSTHFNELDLHFSKQVLKLVRKGTLTLVQYKYKIIIDILPEGAPLTNEIKRRGVIFDRNKHHGERL